MSEDAAGAAKQPGVHPMTIAFGGGKGGVGKSLVCAAVATELGRRNLRVVAVDADFGSPNLHTLLGILHPARTLGDFFDDQSDSLDSLLLESDVPGVRLLTGTAGLVSKLARSQSHRRRFINALLALDVDVILLDLGAGTHRETLDLYNLAGYRVVVTSPEPTSIQNAYAFLKAAIFRRLESALGRRADFQNLFVKAQRTIGQDRLESVQALVDEAAALEPKLAAEIRGLVQSLRPQLVINQAGLEDEKRVFGALGVVARRYLNLRPELLATLPSDPSVRVAVRRMRPVLSDAADAPFGQRIRKLVDALLATPSLPSPELVLDALAMESDAINLMDSDSEPTPGVLPSVDQDDDLSFDRQPGQRPAANLSDELPPPQSLSEVLASVGTRPSEGNDGDAESEDAMTSTPSVDDIVPHHPMADDDPESSELSGNSSRLQEHADAATDGAPGGPTFDENGEPETPHGLASNPAEHAGYQDDSDEPPDDADSIADTHGDDVSPSFDQENLADSIVNPEPGHGIDIGDESPHGEHMPSAVNTDEPSTDAVGHLADDVEQSGAVDAPLDSDVGAASAAFTGVTQSSAAHSDGAVLPDSDQNIAQSPTRPIEQSETQSSDGRMEKLEKDADARLGDVQNTSTGLTPDTTSQDNGLEGARGQGSEQETGEVETTQSAVGSPSPTQLENVDGPHEIAPDTPDGEGAAINDDEPSQSADALNSDVNGPDNAEQGDLDLGNVRSEDVQPGIMDNISNLSDGGFGGDDSPDDGDLGTVQQDIPNTDTLRNLGSEESELDNLSVEVSTDRDDLDSVNASIGVDAPPLSTTNADSASENGPTDEDSQGLVNEFDDGSIDLDSSVGERMIGVETEGASHLSSDFDDELDAFIADGDHQSLDPIDGDEMLMSSQQDESAASSHDAEGRNVQLDEPVDELDASAGHAVNENDLSLDEPDVMDLEDELDALIGDGDGDGAVDGSLRTEQSVPDPFKDDDGDVSDNWLEDVAGDVAEMDGEELGESAIQSASEPESDPFIGEGDDPFETDGDEPTTAEVEESFADLGGDGQESSAGIELEDEGRNIAEALDFQERVPGIDERGQRTDPLLDDELGAEETPELDPQRVEQASVLGAESSESEGIDEMAQALDEHAQEHMASNEEYSDEGGVPATPADLDNGMNLSVDLGEAHTILGESEPLDGRHADLGESPGLQGDDLDPFEENYGSVHRDDGDHSAHADVGENGPPFEEVLDDLVENNDLADAEMDALLGAVSDEPDEARAASTSSLIEVAHAETATPEVSGSDVSTSMDGSSLNASLGELAGEDRSPSLGDSALHSSDEDAHPHAVRPHVENNLADEPTPELSGHVSPSEESQFPVGDHQDSFERPDAIGSEPSDPNGVLPDDIDLADQTTAVPASALPASLRAAMHGRPESESSSEPDGVEFGESLSLESQESVTDLSEDDDFDGEFESRNGDLSGASDIGFSDEFSEGPSRRKKRREHGLLGSEPQSGANPETYIAQPRKSEVSGVLPAFGDDIDGLLGEDVLPDNLPVVDDDAPIFLEPAVSDDDGELSDFSDLGGDGAIGERFENAGSDISLEQVVGRDDESDDNWFDVDDEAAGDGQPSGISDDDPRGDVPQPVEFLLDPGRLERELNELDAELARLDEASELTAETASTAFMASESVAESDSRARRLTQRLSRFADQQVNESSQDAGMQMHQPTGVNEHRASLASMNVPGLPAGVVSALMMKPNGANPTPSDSKTRAAETQHVWDDDPWVDEMSATSSQRHAESEGPELSMSDEERHKASELPAVPELWSSDRHPPHPVLSLHEAVQMPVGMAQLSTTDMAPTATSIRCTVIVDGYPQVSREYSYIDLCDERDIDSSSSAIGARMSTIHEMARQQLGTGGIDMVDWDNLGRGGRVS